MKKNKFMWITTGVCLLPIIFSIIVYKKLPDQVGTHFGGNGEADGYMPKAIAAFGLPVLMAMLNLYTHIALDNDPKKANASHVIKTLGKVCIPLLTIILVPITLLIALGYSISITTISTLIVGVVIVISGNYLPKCKQNYTVGIKLPWTLNDENNWNKTHRFAGYLWMIGGLFIILGAFFKGVMMISTIGVIIALVVLPLVYSFRLYKQQNTKGEVE